MAKRLSEDTIKKIETDPGLFALVAEKMNIKPTSLPQTLTRNSTNLNQYDVVQAIADYLKKDIEEIVAEVELSTEPQN